MTGTSLRDLLAAAEQAASPADYLSLSRRVASAADTLDLPRLRLAVLSSFTLEFCRPFLVVEGLRRGYLLDVYFGPHGQFEQQLADPASSLWGTHPDVLLVSMRPEDISPDAVARFHRSDGAEFQDLMEQVRSRVGNCHRLFRHRAAGPMLIANFAPPEVVPLGILDTNPVNTLTHSLAAANEAMSRLAASLSGTTVWDYAGLVRTAGAASWTDRRLWALGRIAVAAAHQPLLADHLVRTVNAALTRPAKCLVLDLDNTLWGGAVGDVGLDGIALGDDYPGNAYKEFQRTVLGLADRGILLAVVSKNDLEVAREAFERHPEMLIKWDDLAGTRINWRPKSENLRSLAEELNIGSDSLVLFDDNPVERAEVRAGAPEVNVVEAPVDPLYFARALSECGFFDQTGVSEEDRGRVGMYRQERERRDLAERHETVEEFLESLAMEAIVGLADKATLGRISQLVGKTNQFNLTTRRHTPAELESMAADPRHLVAWLRLGDRFGDQGLVAVGILSLDDGTARVDTFLMSCRVMNRGVEQAFMAYLAEEAIRLGCRVLVGEYRPTRKNGMVREFYPSLGFSMDEDSSDDSLKFRMDLTSAVVPWPDHIKRSCAAAGSVNA